MVTMPSISAAISAALLTSDPMAKAFAARRAAREFRLGRLSFAFDTPMPERPAWPEAPLLLHPREMPRRNAGGQLKGRIALWHSLAHIEFVAIDLALDMAGRFGAEMGEEFVSDFLSVAADEAMHFALCERKLRTLGSHYGALPAHAGLWEAAEDTCHDVSARLAIVPMVLEARGLDVTPVAISKMQDINDISGAKVLTRILNDEVRHVGFGTKHFQNWCDQQKIDSKIHWKSLVKCHFKGAIKGPFNDSARLKAGLSRDLYLSLDC